MSLPLSFMLSASKKSLQDFELARRNHASNIRKELRELEEQVRELEAEALFARWMIENRSEVIELCRIDALQLRLYTEPTSAKTLEVEGRLRKVSGND